MDCAVRSIAQKGFFAKVMPIWRVQNMFMSLMLMSAHFQTASYLKALQTYQYFKYVDLMCECDYFYNHKNT